MLKTTQRYLETEGAEALQRAIERSEKFGQQSERMSQTARDARVAVDALEEAASAIELTAQTALNTSTNAYNLARDAVDQQKNTSQEIGIHFYQSIQTSRFVCLLSLHAYWNNYFLSLQFDHIWLNSIGFFQSLFFFWILLSYFKC